MAITASSSGSSAEFELPPAGNHPARCVRIIDLGTTEQEYMGEVSFKRQVFLAFELPTKMKTYKKDDKEVTEPFLATQFYTLSLNEKANLTHLLEGWRGRAFTEEEKAGFDISILAGLSCLLNVVPYKSQTGKDRIRLSASQLPDGMECPPQVNPTVVFSLEDFDQTVFDNLTDGLKKMIMKSDEYLRITGQVGQRPEQSESPAPDGVNHDEIPF